MMFMHPQDETQRQQQDGYDQHPHQQSFLQSTHPQHQAINESDEDAALAAAAAGTAGDGQSLHSNGADYSESDLRDADADTKLLIAHLTDLDVSLFACNKNAFLTIVVAHNNGVRSMCFLTFSAQSDFSRLQNIVGAAYPAGTG